MGTNIRVKYVSRTIVIPNKELVIGIDLSIFIHKFFAVYKNTAGQPFSITLDQKKEYTSHLYGLFKTFGPLTTRNKLVFLLDWNPNLPLKEDIRTKRKIAAERREEKIKEYLKDPRTFTLAKEEVMRRTSYPVNFQLLEKVFSEVGWTLIKVRDIDAEKYGARLVSSSLIDYFITTDSDTLLFGSDYVKKWRVIEDNIEMEVVSKEDTLKENNISYDTLIKGGIITGTDYSPGIKGIGPERVFNYLKEKELPAEFDEIYTYFTNPYAVPSPLLLNHNPEKYQEWSSKFLFKRSLY